MSDGAVPGSMPIGVRKLRDFDLVPGDVYRRVTGHDRWSDKDIGDHYVVRFDSPYRRGALHLVRLPESPGCGWTTTTEEGLFLPVSVSGRRFDPVVEALRDSPLVIEIVQAAREVLRISDRDHDAWRRLRAALSAVEGDDGADRGQP